MSFHHRVFLRWSSTSTGGPPVSHDLMFVMFEGTLRFRPLCFPTYLAHSDVVSASWPMNYVVLNCVHLLTLGFFSICILCLSSTVGWICVEANLWDRNIPGFHYLCWNQSPSITEEGLRSCSFIAFAAQGWVHRAAAAGSPGCLLEMQNLRFHPDPLNQSLHFNMITK